MFKFKKKKNNKTEKKSNLIKTLFVKIHKNVLAKEKKKEHTYPTSNVTKDAKPVKMKNIVFGDVSTVDL